MVKMAYKGLHQSSFRIDMRYRNFEAFFGNIKFIHSGLAWHDPKNDSIKMKVIDYESDQKNL